MKINKQKLREHKEKELQNIIKKIQKLIFEEKVKRTEIKNLVCVTAPGEGKKRTSRPDSSRESCRQIRKAPKKGTKSQTANQRKVPL